MTRARTPKVIDQAGQADQAGREVDRVEALQAEVLADKEGPVLVELVPGTSVRVLPPRMWRISSLTAMRGGDFEGWAKKALASTADFDTFMDVDPTLEQVEQFMKNLNNVSAEGK